MLGPQSGVSTPNSINCCLSACVILFLILSTFKHNTVALDALFCNSEIKNFLGSDVSPVFSTPVRTTYQLSVWVYFDEDLTTTRNLEVHVRLCLESIFDIRRT